MGIPSYFKHLFDRYAGLLTKAGGTTKADILLVDFNCLIYGCIRGPKMPTYTHATKAAWEAAAFEQIGEYVVKLWNVAGKPSRVLLAVDGVVPMAKIKQQRMRRFKSVWLAAKERELGVRAPGQEMWDTNAITPGTEFMEKLGSYLTNLCSKRGPEWTVSGVDEEGEGEQKIMAWVRRSAADLANKRIFVYGLDADLIVLCLLHAGALTVTPGTTWHILRERQEFNVKAAAAISTDIEFLLLSVQALLGALPPDTATNLIDYVAGMSLLGNDFLPHSLSVSIRDGGHDRLLAALRDIHASGLTLVTKSDDGLYKISAPALKRIVEAWTVTLDDDTVRAFQRKYKARGPPPRNESERAMIPVQNLPLEWAAEDRLWSKGTGILHADWRSRYYEDAANQTDIAKRCETYCMGLQWILDYYTGQRPVNMAWLYPWSHPPLWSDLAHYLSSNTVMDAPKRDEGIPPLRPQEQLTIVLPLESWSLVRDPQLKATPERMPSFWPATFDFESLGKRWLWECEPQIPLLIPGRLRA